MTEPDDVGPAKTVERLRPFSVNVFARMSALAAELGAVNLGQGFPDEDGPPAMLEVARQAIADGVNQYPPGPGIAELRRAIAAQRSRRYGQQFDPDTGAGHRGRLRGDRGGGPRPGRAGLGGAGARAVLRHLRSGDCDGGIAPGGGAAGPRRPRIRPRRRRGARRDHPATRAIIVNSPHNPTGMVLSDSELRGLAAVAEEADLLVISDEVYEHLTFDGHRHLPIASYPGMASRTVTISSAAKMFNCTGWKIGWACRAPGFIAGVRTAKQYLSYVSGAPFQPAVAYALDHEDAWVAALRDSLQAKRDTLSAALAGLGFDVHDSVGTYFLCADPRPLGFGDSTAFCEELPRRAGVAAIPMAAFCDPGGAPQAWNHLVRFAFCKRDGTLEEAIRRLSALNPS